jgi:hypothetical protein
MARRPSASSRTRPNGGRPPEATAARDGRSLPLKPHGRLDEPSGAPPRDQPRAARGLVRLRGRSGPPTALSRERQIVAGSSLRDRRPRSLADGYSRQERGTPVALPTGVVPPASDERRHPVRRRRPGQPHRVPGTLARAASPLERSPGLRGVSRPCREGSRRRSLPNPGRRSTGAMRRGTGPGPGVATRTAEPDEGRLCRLPRRCGAFRVAGGLSPLLGGGVQEQRQGRKGRDENEQQQADPKAGQPDTLPQELP